MQTALEHLRLHDQALADLIPHYPEPEFEQHTNYYHELVSSIISQQLSVKAARTIEGRFKHLFDDQLPTPEQILTKDIEQLRAIGLSRPKARYIQDLAEKIIDGSVDFEHIDSLSNDEIIAKLTKVKGIGVWTVHMFLMFCMGRLDVLASGDLGIRTGIAKLYNLPELPTERDVELLAETHKWNPYESIACWYIWQSLDNSPK